jgi:hypothetical protein
MWLCYVDLNGENVREKQKQKDKKKDIKYQNLLVDVIHSIKKRRWCNFLGPTII